MLELLRDHERLQGHGGQSDTGSYQAKRRLRRGDNRRAPSSPMTALPQLSAHRKRSGAGRCNPGHEGGRWPRSNASRVGRRRTHPARLLQLSCVQGMPLPPRNSTSSVAPSRGRAPSFRGEMQAGSPGPASSDPRRENAPCPGSDVARCRRGVALTMAAAQPAACRPPVEEGAEVTHRSYIPSRRKRRSYLGGALPETASLPAPPLARSRILRV